MTAKTGGRRFANLWVFDRPRKFGMKTEAFILREVGKKMRAETVFLDDPGRGEVLVAIAAAGLCRSDLHSIEGNDETPKPIVLGHEAVGIVEKKGDGVDNLQIGERVILSWMPECRACRACLRGNPALCEVADNCYITGELPGGGTRLRDKDGKTVYHYSSVASFARHAVVPASGCISLREESITSESAAAIGCAAITGIGAAVNAAKVQLGDSVVVFGLGGIGLNILQGARLAGAAVIIGVDTNANKRDIALQFGATHFVGGKQKNINRTLSGICNGGADITFDALGHPDIIQNAFHATVSGGKVICVGISPAGTEIHLPADNIVGTGKSIIGCYYGNTNPNRDFPILINLFRNKRILLDELVEEIIPFERIADGFARMQKGNILGRLVARISPE
ncbi:MAG: zinc-binding dehydrogenase [Gammaproteobacteria bacterium]